MKTYPCIGSCTWEILAKRFNSYCKEISTLVARRTPDRYFKWGTWWRREMEMPGIIIWILNTLTFYRKWCFNDTGKLIMFSISHNMYIWHLCCYCFFTFVHFLAKSAIIRGLSSSRWNVYSRCACRIELNAGLAICCFLIIFHKWKVLIYQSYSRFFSWYQ